MRIIQLAVARGGRPRAVRGPWSINSSKTRRWSITLGIPKVQLEKGNMESEMVVDGKLDVSFCSTLLYSLVLLISPTYFHQGNWSGNVTLNYYCRQEFSGLERKRREKVQGRGRCNGTHERLCREFCIKICPLLRYTYYYNTDSTCAQDAGAFLESPT